MDEHPDKKPAKTPDKRKVRRTGQRTKVGKDKWLLRVPLGKVDGKRRTHTETFHGSANQAEDRIREVIRRHRSGEPISVSKDTFGAFLDEWLEAKRQGVSESSLKSYRKLADYYIRPHLGKLLLAQITASEIQRAYGKLRDSGISASTIRHVHDLLNMIFKLAVLRHKLAGSPMPGVTCPKLPDDDRARAMSVEQVQVFLEAARGSRFEHLFRLAFHVGCRPGELLALKWDDLDVKAGTIRIDQNIVFRKSGDWYLKAPKTKKGRRVIPLTSGLIEILKAQETIQREQKSKALYWIEHGFIFTKDKGGPFAQWNVRDDCKAILEKSGLPDYFSPKTARHTAATLLMATGQHPKLVSEQLGHSRISITLDTYTHPDEEMRAGLTAEIERLLEAGDTADTDGKGLIG